MTLLAVTYAVVLTLSESCLDDRLIWSPAAADVATLQVSLDGATIATLPPQSTSYALGCLSGRACLNALDVAGNAAAACFVWEPDPKMLLVVERSCAVGCFRPKRDGRCCTAPIAVLPQGE